MAPFDDGLQGLTPSRRSLLALAAGGSTAAVLSTASATSAGEIGGKHLSVEIDRLIAIAMKAAPFAGLCIAIEKNGRILHRKAYGIADIENSVPVKTRSVFPIGSITKTMTGLCVMQLVEQGKIGLDATAGYYCTDLPKPARDIKIRNLLDHTSGLVNYVNLPDFPWDSQGAFTRNDMLGWFASRPLEFEPGSRWSYTNSGLYVLGLVIEKVSGVTYEDYLQQHVFKPFGMTSTSLAGWRKILQDRVHGYLRGRNGLENAPRYDPLVPFSAGAVLSTIDDMLRYRRGVFGDGPTSPEVRALLLQRDRLSDGTMLPYALGCLAVTEFEGHRKIGHPGDIFGFSAQYSYYPDDELTVVLMTNMQNGALPPISVEQKIARVVLGIPQPRNVDMPLPPLAAATFVGTYKVGNIRFGFDRLDFVLKDGALCVGFDGSEKASAILLKYRGESEFVSALDDEQRFRFQVKDNSANVTMFYYGGEFQATKIAP